MQQTHLYVPRTPFPMFPGKNCAPQDEPGSTYGTYTVPCLFVRPQASPDTVFNW